jgi:hypothetical protein
LKTTNIRQGRHAVVEPAERSPTVRSTAQVQKADPRPMHATVCQRVGPSEQTEFDLGLDGP